MSNKDIPKIEKLIKNIDRLGARSALGIVAALGAFYFLIAYSRDPQPQNGWQIAIELALSIITNIIPIFLLFLLSYTLLREINEIKDEDKVQRLLRKFREEISSILEERNPDKLFNRKSPDLEVIRKARKKLLLVQETGNLLFESSRSELISFLTRGGQVELILATPSVEVAKYLAFRNASLKGSDPILDRTKGFQNQLRGILEKAPPSHGKIKIRYCPYPIDFTMTMADPDDENNGEATIRLAGFRVPYEEKLDLTLSAKISPKTFKHYAEQFNHLFSFSAKIILLSGEPHVGKTTFFSSLINELPASENFFYAITPQSIDDNGNRVGFNVITVNKPAIPTEYAKRLSGGGYAPKTEIWDDIADKVIAAASAGQVIILDEIGQLQLKSEKFRATVLKILENPKATLIATIGLQSAGDHTTFLNNLKNHPRSTHYILENGNESKQKLHSIFKDEIQSALTTAEINRGPKNE